MSGKDAGTLLTGATGFLGGQVLARMLKRDELPVYALVRAGSDEEANDRLEAVVRSVLAPDGVARGRAIALRGDVTVPDLGLDAERRAWLAERTDRIVHSAASVSFTLGLEESRAINVDGTRRMLELAELCSSKGGLECFTHVSTAYVAGTYEGEFSEDALDLGQGFRNAYERSKFEAERLARERSGEIPLQVVRPSIIVCDSRTGWTSSFNVLYTPLRAFTLGAYPVIPARRSSPVDVVPVDYVADSIVALADRPGGGTYNLTAAGRASSVGEIIDLASSHADRPPPRAVSPRLYKRLIHPLLVRRAGESQRRALRRSEVFFPYFEMRGRFANSRARRALEPLGIEPPPLRTYFDRLIGFAQRAQWGRARGPAASAA